MPSTAARTGSKHQQTQHGDQQRHLLRLAGCARTWPLRATEKWAIARMPAPPLFGDYSAHSGVTTDLSELLIHTRATQCDRSCEGGEQPFYYLHAKCKSHKKSQKSNHTLGRAVNGPICMLVQDELVPALAGPEWHAECGWPVGQPKCISGWALCGADSKSRYRH